MRYAASLLALGLLLAPVCQAQESHEDVIYLKNGGIMHGVIIEIIPDKSVKLRSKDGNVYVFSMDEIERIAKEPALRQGVESWYLYFALGYGNTYYASSLQQKVDRLGVRSSRTCLSMELLGVYWPLRNDRTIIGGSISAIADQFKADKNTTMIQQHLYAFSVMHFLGGEIGEGVFLRGDAGIAVLVFTAGSWEDLDSRSAGIGVMAGGGYAFPVSDETRITANIHYGMRFITGETHGALSINVGVLL